jgi:hypothetical protein
MHYTIRSVIEQAWQLFLEQTVSVLPHVLAGLLVFFIGLVLSAIVNRVATRLLRASRVDRLASRLGLSLSLEMIGITSTVRLLARALQWLIVFLASILALYSLDARLASDLAERFFLYLPHLVVALVILALGVILARFLSRSVLISAVNSEIQGARLLAALTRAAVMVVAGAIAFEHLGVGRTTVLTAFAILFGGATLAAAIAVGLGSQELVRRWLLQQTATPPTHTEEETIRHW